MQNTSMYVEGEGGGGGGEEIVRGGKIVRDDEITQR